MRRFALISNPSILLWCIMRFSTESERKMCRLLQRRNGGKWVIFSGSLQPQQVLPLYWGNTTSVSFTIMNRSTSLSCRVLFSLQQVVKIGFISSFSSLIFLSLIVLPPDPIFSLLFMVYGFIIYGSCFIFVQFHFLLAILRGDLNWLLWNIPPKQLQIIRNRLLKVFLYPPNLSILLG